MRRFATTIAIAIALLPGVCAAKQYRLAYTTFADGVFAAASVDALLTVDDGSFYGAPGYLVTGISGTRDGVAISGLADPFSEIFVPATPDIVDSFGITFTAGDRDYNFYRNSSSFYQEFSYLSVDGSDGEGRLVFDSAVSLTAVAEEPGTTSAVPEPATWLLMVAGLGLSGLALRRRKGLVRQSTAG